MVSILFFSNELQATYVERKFHGERKQLYDNTCGLASVRFVLNRYYNVNVTEVELISKVDIKPEYSFLDLTILSKFLGLKVLGVKITINQLEEIHSPTILHISRLGKGHFVVFLGVNSQFVQLYDPAWGYINYTRRQFEKYWRHGGRFGRALIFLKDEKIDINHELINQKNIPLD